MRAILLIFPVLLIPLLGRGQTVQMSVFAGGGGYEVDANNSVSWTLGEANIITLTGSNILTQGFQQSKYNVTTGVLDFQDKQIMVKAFPNPTQDEISISFSEELMENVFLEIQDAQGKALQNLTIQQKETILSMQRFPEGLYFFSICTQAGKTTTLSIVKH